MNNLPQNWLDLPLAVVDVETTSLDYNTGRIIEIGIVRFEKGKVAEVYDQLIDPESPIPQITTDITGITDEDVAGQPKFSQVANEIVSRLTDVGVVAYNLDFDKGYITHELEQCGHAWPECPEIDPLLIARKTLPGRGNKSLGQVCKMFEVPLENAHRASHDAEATGHLLYKIADKFSNIIPTETIEFIDLLKKWKEEQSKPRSGSAWRSTTLSNDLPVGLGSAFIYGAESDHLRALYSTVPEIKKD